MKKAIKPNPQPRPMTGDVKEGYTPPPPPPKPAPAPKQTPKKKSD